MDKRKAVLDLYVDVPRSYLDVIRAISHAEIAVMIHVVIRPR